MSKNERRRSKGKSNEEVMKSVLGENYVPQYSKTTSEELKAKQSSDVTRAPTKKTISVMPVSFPNDEASGVPQPTPMPSGISRRKIKDLLHVVKRFPSCDELRLDFSNEQLVIKKNGMYHVITFEGEKLLSYTFDGKYIDAK